MTFLTDDTLTVSLDVNWDSSNIANRLIRQSLTAGGDYADIIWSNIPGFNLSVDTVQNSDSQLINQWHETQTQLILYFDSVSYDVLLTNGNTPFNSPSRPYHDLYNGFLQLERV
jgi:hypothetical protein